jgi:hypothetical protein
VVNKGKRLLTNNKSALDTAEAGGAAAGGAAAGGAAAGVVAAGAATSGALKAFIKQQE